MAIAPAIVVESHPEEHTVYTLPMQSGVFVTVTVAVAVAVAVIEGVAVAVGGVPVIVKVAVGVIVFCISSSAYSAHTTDADRVLFIL